jgi:hypothetical protein
VMVDASGGSIVVIIQALTIPAVTPHLGGEVVTPLYSSLSSYACIQGSGDTYEQEMESQCSWVYTSYSFRVVEDQYQYFRPSLNGDAHDHCCNPMRRNGDQF